MSQSDDLLCLFSATVDAEGERSVIEVPAGELSAGTLEPGETYRVGVYPSAAGGETASGNSGVAAAGGRTTAATAGGGTAQTSDGPTHLSDRPREPPADEPPIEEGEVIEVEIEDMGDQGDGIARVGPGFIVFVSDTEIGERVSIAVTTVKDTVAFGEVRERLD